MRAESKEALKYVAAAVISPIALWLAWKFLRPASAQATLTGSPTTCNNGAGRKEKEEDQDHGEGLWIYFGSQSGTAEGFANEIGEEAAAHGQKAHVVDLEEFSAEVFVEHKVVVLVLATYGEGDPTDNAVEFFNWLKNEDHSENLLKGMRFTVMGLGSRQYVHFNSASKTAWERMQKLGASSFHVLGEGDDDQDIEEDFAKWKDGGFWPAVSDATGVQSPAHSRFARASSESGSAEEVLAKLHLRAEVYSKGPPPVDPLVQVGGADVLGKWYFGASVAPVVVCKELRQAVKLDDGKTTKHIELDLERLPALDWRTADNLEVLPRNPDDVVAWFAKRLGVDDHLEDSLEFVRVAGTDKACRKPFPTPCKVNDALGLYCDLCRMPARGAAHKFAALAADHEDRAAIERLLHDREAYHWVSQEGRLGLREFFELWLPSAELDLSAFLQLCPRQKSRAYTISTSSREERKRVGICVSMVQEAAPSIDAVVTEMASRGHPIPQSASRLGRLGGAPTSRAFRGVCSTMLCSRTSEKEELTITVRASSFRLPRKHTAPIIMVGAGTGIAPFRGFVREFMAEGGRRTRTLLFFGCTRREDDFIYRDELEQALATEPPALGELVTAFSREQEHKVYVQHRVRERAEQVAQWMNEGAYFYVCGSVAMGKAVREELAKAVGNESRLDRLQTEGRFVEELW